MGKFFNEKVKRRNNGLGRLIIISIGIIFIIILFILIARRNKKQTTAVPKLQDQVEVEVNGNWPSKFSYFSEYEGLTENDVTIDQSAADINKVGAYTITVNVKGYNPGHVTLNVVDHQMPTLTLKDVTINEGEKYTVDSFVNKCEDNSHEKCILEYDLSQDYANYSEPGNYIIYIRAKDSSGNVTEYKEANLKINSATGTPNDDTPTTADCQYGDLTMNEDKYPVAVIVGNEKTNCAINRDLWDNTSIQEPVNKFYQKDYSKLKTEMKSILESKYPNGAKIVAEPHYINILNTSLKGIVGYAIYVKIYVADANTTESVDKDENLVLAYYLNKDGSRKYEVNKYNLK